MITVDVETLRRWLQKFHSARMSEMVPGNWPFWDREIAEITRLLREAGA